jgi:hypothetical protein
MPVLRSVRSAIAKAVRRAIGYVTDTIYGAGGFEPSLTADFTEEFYRGPGVSNFTDLITHARAGNATMTDGYGPELLTNGDFSTGDTTGFFADSNPVVSRGVITIPIVSGGKNYIQQTISTEEGKTYIVTGKLIDADSNSRQLRVSAQTGNSGAQTGDLGVSFTSLDAGGNLSFVFTTTSAQNTTIRFICNTITAGHFASFDNLSVREMPVIKFAPHNYQRYSDDVSQGAGSTGVTRTATTLTETTSTGEHRINSGISPPVVGEKYTMALEAKSGTGSRNILFRGYGEGGADKYPVFDIVNGTVRQTGTAFTDVSITDVGDGYYLCRASVVASSAFRWAVHMADETATLGNNAVHSYTGDGSSSVLLRKLRQYRSDLGGMVDNPDNSGNDADFIATSGSEAYLPRIGHHVYNGSAWVNEGVLAESQARTNLLPYSTPDSNWNNSNSFDTANQAIAPDGTETATLIVDNTVNQNHYMESIAVSISGSAVTGSMYIKKESLSFVRLRLDGTTNNRRAWFDIENGTVETVDANSTGTIEDVGNGWFRCSLTEPDNTASGTAKLQVFLQTAGNQTSYTGDGSSGLYVWGAQLEQASMPSSFIPTDAGASVTRAAETFTIPSANLPWPEPQYIGSELVTSGTFDDTSALDDWTGVGADVANTSFDNGTIKLFGNSAEYQAITTVVGKVYAASVEVTATTATNPNLRVGTTANGTQNVGSSGLSVGSYTFYFVATATTSYVTLKTNYAVGNTAKSTNFDNVSVREINPLAVSIAMKGRVSYKDNGTFTDDLPFYWQESGANSIDFRLDGNSTNVGKPIFVHRIDSDQDLSFGEDQYLEDAQPLQPYNAAARITSTRIQAAFDGISYAEATISNGLVDLSSTDLRIAFNYMGTISEFRIWDRDITDDGLVEATNPSLEPSLSLTFEGTGTNSFVVNNWSK